MRSEPQSLAAGRRSYLSTIAVLGAGAIATVLAALPYKVFDLDRYAIPKEFTLHLTATLAAVAAIVALGRSATGANARPNTRSASPAIPLSRVDTLLIGFLLFSGASAFLSQNGWLAARGLAISASGIVLFWVAHSLARAGWARSVLALMAAAITIAAATSLLQAYGAETELFSLNRSPGGTLGNRNFVAHLAAIGVPLLIVIILRARRIAGATLGAMAIAIVSAALVLSRSRAAWVATAVALLCVLPAAWRGWQSMRGRSSGMPRQPSGEGPPSVSLRGSVAFAAIAAGIIAAVTLPNSLNWKSPSPYLDSVINVTNYREGSGHGRLIQYANTARLAISHPVLGVGPGNWAVVYPKVAPKSDPSLDTDDGGMTANPWPSSDWAAFLSERGVPATICLALALLGLIVAAARAAAQAVDDGRADRLLIALALAATVLAIVAVGAFDAVLLLPAPSLIAWSILGALAGSLEPPPAERGSIRVPVFLQRVAIVIVLVAGGAAVVRSASEIVAMALYVAATRTGVNDHTLELATHMDPGSYRIQLRLAESYAHGRSCSRARTHGAAARALFPTAAAPRHVLAECTAAGGTR
jgi:O-antigen ligase